MTGQSSVPRLICIECGHYLTDDEMQYFETTCNECELVDMYRHRAWRHGADDPELDARYGGTPTPRVLQ